jgi:hypothetical protein
MMENNQTPSSDTEQPKAVSETLKSVQSVEQVVAERIELISRAYMQLMNVGTSKEALECLGQIGLVSQDLERQIRRILDACGVPPQLIRKISPEQIKKINEKKSDHDLSQDHNLDTIWNHAVYCYQRFLHAQTPEFKVKELTSLYYLLKDVAAIALETPADRYATGVKRVKEVIQGGW